MILLKDFHLFLQDLNPILLCKMKEVLREERRSPRASSSWDAENAFALSFVQSKAIAPAIVAREKAQPVKKNVLLEIIETKETLDSIGGLDVLKTWFLRQEPDEDCSLVSYRRELLYREPLFS